MKDHNLVFENVMERKKEYEIKKSRTRKIIGTTTLCLCLGVVSVFGVTLLNDKNSISTDNGLEFVVTEDARFTQSIPDDFSIEDLEVTTTYSESHSANGNSEQQTPIVNPPFNATDNATEYNPITMVSDYEADEQIQTTPQNSQLIKSYALEKAIAEYGDDVLYRVYVEIYSDGQLLVGDDKLFEAEITRLSESGINVAFETYFDGVNEHYYFTLHTYKSKLDSFPVNENYGYILYLYDEKVE